MNTRNPLLFPSLFISLQFSALRYRHNIYPWLQTYQQQILSSPLVWASLRAQLVKNPPAMWETWVQSLGWEDPLEKGKATHSRILAWRIPWTV